VTNTFSAYLSRRTLFGHHTPDTNSLSNPWNYSHKVKVSHQVTVCSIQIMSPKDEDANGLAQVSEEFLNSLVTTVSSLRESVSQLQDKNKTLVGELRSLKGNFAIIRRSSGVRFSSFPKLPVEI
jgi:hypothetical protein